MNVRIRRVVLAAFVAWVVPSVVLAGTVTLTIRDGRATLVARDATVRQILAEWARVGGTRIVNLERVPGGPVTLEFTDLPESQALRIILKPLGGFLAAPRPVVDPALSRFDRIVVMTTLATPAPVVTAATAPRAPAPTPASPNFRQMPAFGEGPLGMRGRRFDNTPDRTGDGEDAEEADETAADDFRRQQSGRPPLGMRPPQLPSSGESQDNERTTPAQTPVTPGLIVPGTTATRPGVIVPPPKPPGD